MMTKKLRNVFCCFAVFFLTCFILIQPAVSEEAANEKISLNQYGIRSTNPYVVNRFIEDGKSIDEIIVPGSPHPPAGVFGARVLNLPKPDITAGLNTISNVPALTWCFGCSATSAAMMFGHYDNSGYSNMYAGPTNAGVFPMTNATWGTVVINGGTRALCPLSATRLDLDGRTNRGHVDDYWIRVDNPGPDPFIGSWTEHTYGECTGDYMGTNQSLLDNVDGGTRFYYYPDGSPLYDYTGGEPDKRDGCHGLRLFAESRGYTVQALGNFNQYIYGYDGNTQGFSFDNFKTEIDAGRPVLIHVTGHTMLGYGYNDTGSTIYIHDTWDYSDHSMTWGGTYLDMQHYGVTVLRLAAAAPTPPVAPTLTVTTSEMTVSLSWSTSLSATGYRLLYAPYPDATYTEMVDLGNTTSFSADLWIGAAYYVYLQAYNSYGDSDYSNMEHFVIGSYIFVNPTSLSLSVGATSNCTISNGTSPYSASSSNTSVATASVSGSTLIVTGISAGSATITVSDSGSDSATVSVTVSGTSSTYTNSLGQTFNLLLAGTFTMGSPSDELGRWDDETQHQVTLTQPFYMQTTEVTQAQWEAVMGSNPSYFSWCPTCPVEKVSWNDVQSYITKMNLRGDGTYSLPTEAQWEYAARAGSTTAFYNGGITGAGCDYDQNLNAIGWYCYNSGSETHPVAGKAPNAWGLYDMSGNVYEWCQDWYGSYSASAVTDPQGPSTGSYRVLRGGSWYGNAQYCRAAFRDYGRPGYGYYIIGFRLVLSSGQ